MKPQFESQANMNCFMFRAIEYRTQVVAGTMSFIKVCICCRRECLELNYTGDLQSGLQL